MMLDSDLMYEPEPLEKFAVYDTYEIDGTIIVGKEAFTLELESELDLRWALMRDSVYIDSTPPKLTPHQAMIIKGDYREGEHFYRTSANIEVVQDYRCHFVYNIETKEQVYIDKVGNLAANLTPLEPPSMFHVFKDGKWLLDAAGKATQLTEHKKYKLAELAQQAEQYIHAAANIASVPEFEKATWNIQRAEALAWQADNNIATPMLADIATARGVDLNQLRAKALQKALAYQTLSAAVTGKRQKFEDMINACKTLAELEQIEVKF